MSGKKTSEPRAIEMFRVHVSPGARERVARVLQSGYVGEGAVVKELELAFASVSGARWNTAVSSGTAALHLALILAGVSEDDEVVTTAQTMIATGHAVLMQRARPVFADIQPTTGNLDPADIERRVTPRTKAILVVHWAGYPCDLDEIHSVARRHGLVVIEDAAHAIGATYRGCPVGGISPMTCFSFQAIKHITGGDGGMLALREESAAVHARRLRWFGIDREQRRPTLLGEPEWNVAELGFKYQMNDIAAALVLGNLAHLQEILARRRAIAARYNLELRSVPGLVLPGYQKDHESAFWFFPVFVERRDNFVRHLSKMGIAASVVHFRIDRNDLYGGEREDLPGLRQFTGTHIGLPVHEGLSDEEVSRVIRTIGAGW